MREVRAYANRFVEVFDDEVEFPDGAQGCYLRIVHVGTGPGVVILPVHAGSVGLVYTYRYPLGAWQWGLPRGFGRHPDPEVTARAELRQELGVEAAKVRLLGMQTPDSGLLASRVAIMLAEVADPSGRPQDRREVAASRWVPLHELRAMAAANELEDGMTLAALALADAKGVFEPPHV
ncbi:NUDIX hydrolase [Streptosporangium lutulentum]|uniref:8-oxo-dGTP pyrophosphatase MutT (NUDIX family) n=1 Tax=Streptosporangium lutulentum TaxID=1461250 RepID=A0ABT9QC06_9ACTN|nr:NUDIX hydrolase [Streptosporangium lutulentum]MDP9844290.1 8-oxo-dGTP pyrophosphatase MutT (NUDIX family) [Streptosporangium lutulentum]